MTVMLRFTPQFDGCIKIQLAFMIRGFKYKGIQVYCRKCMIPTIPLLSMNIFHYKLINIQVVKLEVE